MADLSSSTAAWTSIRARLAEKAPDAQPIHVEMSPTRVSVRIQDVDSDGNGLMPLAAAGHALGLTDWSDPQWLGDRFCYRFAGRWQGHSVEVVAYGQKRVHPAPEPLPVPRARRVAA